MTATNPSRPAAVSPTETSGPVERNTSFAQVAAAIAKRGLQRILRVPTLLIPAIIMPLFFLITFTGTFSAVTQVDGYGTDKAVNWFVAYSVIMGAAFSGVGAAGAAAADLENGFFDRLRLSPGNSLAILLGLLSYSLVRATLPTTAVLLLAAGMGASFSGGPLGVALVYVSAWGVAATIGFLGLSIVFKVKTTQSLAMLQIFIFTFTFLSIGQAPLQAIEGWLHAVARFNPMTNILRMARQGFLGEVTWAATWPGLVAIAALVLCLGNLAAWQLRNIED